MFFTTHITASNNRELADLRIARGIRKPCYSTSLPYLSLYSGGGSGSAQDGGGVGGGEEEYQHSAPVVQVESVSPYQVCFILILHGGACLHRLL